MKERLSFAQFEFDLAGAVLEQLLEAFDDWPISELNPATLAGAEEDQGIYQLFLDSTLMYIGKTDNLCERLERHYGELSARQNIDVEKLGFKTLFAESNRMMLLEDPQVAAALVQIASWNAKWGDSLDPRHDVDPSIYETAFDLLHPVNPNYTCDWIDPGEYRAWNLLMGFKEGLPYPLYFRHVTRRSGNESERATERELHTTKIAVPLSNMPAQSLLREIARQLPGEWEANCFPGGLTLHRETSHHRGGYRIWPES